MKKLLLTLLTMLVLAGCNMFDLIAGKEVAITKEGFVKETIEYKVNNKTIILKADGSFESIEKSYNSIDGEFKPTSKSIKGSYSYDPKTKIATISVKEKWRPLEMPARFMPLEEEYTIESSAMILDNYIAIQGFTHDSKNGVYIKIKKDKEFIWQSFYKETFFKSTIEANEIDEIYEEISEINFIYDEKGFKTEFFISEVEKEKIDSIEKGKNKRYQGTFEDLYGNEKMSNSFSTTVIIQWDPEKEWKFNKDEKTWEEEPAGWPTVDKKKVETKNIFKNGNVMIISTSSDFQ